MLHLVGYSHKLSKKISLAEEIKSITIYNSWSKHISGDFKLEGGMDTLRLQSKIINTKNYLH